MSTGPEKRQRKRATRAQSASQTPAKESAPVSTAHTPTEAAAREHYRREKARRAGRVRPAEHPLEQARRAYDALLAADAERAKGGRPKKSIAPPTRKQSSADESDEDQGD